MASNIRNGYEHREVKCLIHYDFNRRVKTFSREDTGEQVQEEIITADESQQEIPGLTLIDTETIDVEMVRKCRVCGCTDDDCSECIDETGEPCHWVEDDLCSRCATPASDPADLPEPPLGSDAPELTMISNGWVRKVNDDFISQMNAAKTANEGRNIISAFEDRLNQLQRAAGVEPVVGNEHGRPFSSLSKKEITAICKAVSKADPGIGMVHTSLVEQWPVIDRQWNALLDEEHQQYHSETEN